MSKETDLAWLAGFFEGDGNITICKRPGFYHGICKISQKKKQILEYILDTVALFNIKGYGPFGPYTGDVHAIEFTDQILCQVFRP